MEFLGRGREGYAEVHNETKRLAYTLYEKLCAISDLEVINAPDHLPVVCWTMATRDSSDLYRLADAMKEIGGWHVPTYPLPRNVEHVTIQRFVCRADLTEDMVDRFVDDLRQAIGALPSIRSVG